MTTFCYRGKSVRSIQSHQRILQKLALLSWQKKSLKKTRQLLNYLAVSRFRELEQALTARKYRCHVQLSLSFRIIFLPICTSVCNNSEQHRRAKIIAKLASLLRFSPAINFRGVQSTWQPRALISFPSSLFILKQTGREN